MPAIRSLIVLLMSLGTIQATSSQEPAVPRTADPAKRGFTEGDFPRTRQLSPGVYTYEALRSAGAERFTTVSLFVVTPAGVLVADGQGSVEETARLVAAIRAVTPQPITHLVIASDHGDHTAGNAAFAADLVTYAHPTSIKTLGGGATAAVPQRLTPVDSKVVVTLGGTEVHVVFLGRAHTGGDLSVYLPKEKILFMSEAYLNRVFPAMRSAYPSEWIATIEKAQAMDVRTFVPGHGFVESPAVLKEELEVAKRALQSVIQEVTRLHRAGTPIDEAITQAKFGDLETWSLRASQAPIAVRRVYAELNGQLR